MSLTSYIKGKNIKTALHIGAYTGEELSNYASWGFKKVIWVEANPQMYIELCDNLTKTDYGVENITFNELISDKDDEPTDFHLYYCKIIVECLLYLRWFQVVQDKLLLKNAKNVFIIKLLS